MGLSCSCGVRSRPTATTLSITLNFVDGGLRSGPLIITVDACTDRLELSTISVSFDDQSGLLPNKSFSFTSTSITGISCSDFRDDCAVSIQGMGLVTGEVTPRQFGVLLLNRPLPNSSRLQSLFIPGFVSNNTLGDLTPNLMFFGCPTS
ncbi:hypothetical protein FAY30_23400 [Bacillus sp. S3]|uniref:hypothetical protein n=1 Tax=Bacillus sp. S3 TaxID=486398 RepID=UPI0011882897|nr:hypothetical protein [Bacillus sp. S3]QCJ44597.1 hypothetical protein FAY30_23400 [Bacillus sp. S3]